MIHLFKTCMITAFILGLTWSAPLRAQDQRYISIRNTDTIWLPGNICAYQFRLDNGGNDEGFGPLTTTEIIKATEESNGHRVSLPLSVFDPQDYHPLLITVSGKNVN